jgi:hypothetical protein
MRLASLLDTAPLLTQDCVHWRGVTYCTPRNAAELTHVIRGVEKWMRESADLKCAEHQKN